MPQPSFLAASLYVALGGGTGAWLRFLVGRAWTAMLGPVRASEFPYGTLTVNVLGSLFMGLLVGWLGAPAVSAFPFATLAVNTIGSLLMGLLAGWLVRGSPEGADQLRLLLGVGLLGGFTTFSSFSLDIVSLAERGQLGLAAFYTGISVIAGVASLFIGLSLMRHVG